MTEKEFLLKAFWELPQIKANGSYEEWVIMQEMHINGFLEMHHKTYYEVEFIRLFGEEEPLTFKGVPMVFDKDIK
jgi:hypothetical protein